MDPKYHIIKLVDGSKWKGNCDVFIQGTRVTVTYKNKVLWTTTDRVMYIKEYNANRRSKKWITDNVNRIASIIKTKFK